MPFISQCYHFWVPLLITVYIQGVLKFKCKTPVPVGGGEESHNRPIGRGASGAYAPGPDEEDGSLLSSIHYGPKEKYGCKGDTFTTGNSLNDDPFSISFMHRLPQFNSTELSNCLWTFGQEATIREAASPRTHHSLPVLTTNTGTQIYIYILYWLFRSIK